MWKPYTEQAQTFFANAAIVIDKYHFIRQVTWAIENVCKRIQKNMPSSLRKYYKRSRSLILTRYDKLKDEKKKEFFEWISTAEQSQLTEFEKCAATYRHWSKEILNAFKYSHISNGPTEGFNNKIKVLKRTSYGIKNFRHFRTRILLTMH